ncbi:MAG: LexA family transcriptional regulator [Bacteroidetes bacterium]|nr:LexA family transcriptional regulator [Bacteroidota bacterium]
MYFPSNIKLLRKRRNRTQDDVACALGMKRSTLSGYENEVAQPPISALVAISDYFRLAVDTLIKVDLRTLSESQMTELDNGFDVYLRGSNLRVLATTVDRNNVDNIELVNEKAKAGYKNGYADPEYIRTLPVFQLPFLSKSRKYRTFQINGDSMLPIPDKAYVTGEFIENWTYLKEGDACIILTLDDGILFKLLGSKITGRRPLRLISLNPLYDPYDIEVGDIKEIWKFINYISPAVPEPELPKNELQKTVAALKKDMDKIKARISAEDH